MTLRNAFAFFLFVVLSTPVNALGAEAKAEGALSILAWPGYIERGESDKKYDWVTAFEKSSGCKVVVTTAATSDEMVQKLNTPGFDLVTASGDASVRLMKIGRVQVLDLAQIPAWKTIDSRLQSAPWHSLDGKTYGVPWQWGPNVLMFNTKAFKTPPTSWSVVFEPQTLSDGKSNTGRVQAYDGPIYLADAALYLMKKRPELGIKDPFELDPKQYQEVLRVVRAQHALVQRYWHDTTAQVEDFKKTAAVVSGAWGYQVNALKAEGQPIDSVIPDEGSTGWADSTMLVTDAPHPKCAYRWLQWSLDPSVQAAVAEWYGAIPAVSTACKVKAPGGSDFCKTNGFDRFARTYFWKTPEFKCSTQKVCVPYRTWDTDYAAIKSGK
jgi:putative spermidine/putrescine transport system substrate-binding protein